ncbi:MAG: hypothetical protein LUC91_10305, partial [Prevotella sp.]|nr:hypothetical protein [Prevotella sp.]
FEKACDSCTDFMKIMTISWDMSYGTLNTLLFLILGPLGILCYLIAPILIHKGHRRISIIPFWGGSISIFIMMYMMYVTFIDILIPTSRLTNEMLDNAHYINCYEGTSMMDKICYTAIHIFRVISIRTGISYAALNIFVYVFIGPLSTTSYFLSSVFAWYKKPKTSKVFHIIGSVMVSIVILLLLTAI